MAYSNAPDTAKIKKEIPEGYFHLKGINATYDLYNIDEYDEELLRPFYFKPDEKVYRFQTARMRDLFKPLVKINIEKKLIYFLTDEAKETDKIHFETRGIKAQYLNAPAGKTNLN